ncbi:glycosyltransferase family 4 protein [Flavitalea antarctica]
MPFYIEKPRILIFIGSLRAGGKERRLIELLSYLKARNSFRILVVMTKNEIHYSEFYNLNIEYRIIRKKWRKNAITVFIQFYKICKEFNPDIIHTWGRMQSLYAVPAVIMKNTPMVNGQITSAPAEINNLTLNRLIDLINFRFSHIILANSRKGFDAFKPPFNKRKLILNGLNLSRFENLPPTTAIKTKYKITTPYTVIMLASFSPAKDYDLFFKLARMVTGLRDDISFIGVGGYDGNDSEYQRMCKLSEDFPRIIFQSEIRDPEALVNACTIGVLFSTNGEGTSNSILEYMALGKPVLATDAGGNSELIRNGNNGYLIGTETVSEICNLIIGLIDDPEKARLFGERSKRKIHEEFSSDVMGKAFEKVYMDALVDGTVIREIRQSVLTQKT